MPRAAPRRRAVWRSRGRGGWVSTSHRCTQDGGRPASRGRDYLGSIARTVRRACVLRVWSDRQNRNARQEWDDTLEVASCHPSRLLRTYCAVNLDTPALISALASAWGADSESVAAVQKASCRCSRAFAALVKADGVGHGHHEPHLRGEARGRRCQTLARCNDKIVASPSICTRTKHSIRYPSDTFSKEVSENSTHTRGCERGHAAQQDVSSVFGK